MMSGFKVGDLVLSCTPYAYALNTEFKNQYCDFCFKENSHLKKCSRCSFTYYCDKSCQTKAWVLHQTECRYIKKSVVKPNAYVRCDALVMFKVKKYGINNPSVVVGDRKISFETLMSHAEDMKQNVKEKEKIEFWYSYLQEYIGPDNTPPLKEMFEIYGKTRINAFSILDVSQTESIGVGLYLEASVFNHSCDPDAFVVFDGITWNIRMIKNVSHQNISDIRISYLNTSIQLTEERRLHLSEKYYFHCECKLCISSHIDDLMMKLVNDTDETKEKAVQCEKAFKEKEKSIKELLIKNPQVAWQECKKLLKLQSEVLADTNIYKVKTLRMALDACLALNASKDVIETASNLENSLRFYLGNVHFELGSFLLFYGKHLYSSGLKVEGLAKLLDAGNMYKVMCGEEHPFFKSMNNFIFHILQSNVQDF